jgi:membrane protease YdiL (CAAX protease family)
MITESITPSAQPEAFTSLSDRGKNTWWRYVLAVGVILVCWQVVGSIPIVLFYLSGWTKDIFLNFIAVNLSFVIFLLSIWLAIRFIHERPFLSLITPFDRFNGKRALLGFGWWTCITAVITIVDSLVHPGLYQVSFQWPGWLWFALSAILLTTIQASTEEIFFRGYLLQSIARVIHSKAILVILSGLVFAIPHFFNPEMKSGFVLLALFYFGFGVFLTLITLKDNRLELAIGIHSANNLFSVIIANYKESALPSISIFTSEAIEPLFNLVTFVIGAVVFWFLIRYLSRTMTKTDGKAIE